MTDKQHTVPELSDAEVHAALAKVIPPDADDAYRRAFAIHAWLTFRGWPIMVAAQIHGMEPEMSSGDFAIFSAMAFGMAKCGYPEPEVALAMTERVQLLMLLLLVDNEPADKTHPEHFKFTISRTSQVETAMLKMFVEHGGQL